MHKEKDMCMRKASKEALGNVGRMALLCKVHQVSRCLPKIPPSNTFHWFKPLMLPLQLTSRLLWSALPVYLFLNTMLSIQPCFLKPPPPPAAQGFLQQLLQLWGYRQNDYSLRNRIPSRSVKLQESVSQDHLYFIFTQKCSKTLRKKGKVSPGK